MKCLVFGTGEYYQRYKKWLEKEEIVALLDNSPTKQNTVIDGKEVLSPMEGISRDYDVIIIMSFHVKTMKTQLLNLGVSAEKIYHFYDLRKLIHLKENRQDIQYYGITEQEIEDNAGNFICLLSTDLALGGTAIALFHMAKILKKSGHSIIFASMIDGPLREQIEELNIPLVIDSNLQLATMRETEWLTDFRLIICNAINYYIFLSERDLRIPIIWWLHDSDFFYDGVDKNILRQISQENLTVLSVGPVPERAVHKVIPNMPVGQLLYGVDNNISSDKTNQNEKICFVTIGCIEERKGQDVLLQAISLLEETTREKAIFYLVGQDTSLLAEQIKAGAKSMPEVVVTGVVGRREIHKILSNANVMICPSREDPMPTVAVEAMLHSVPCILSDITGTADYIQDKENGFIFESGNAVELAEKISWCVENKLSLTQMGKKARQIYETYFSMEKFSEEVEAIISECLGRIGDVSDGRLQKDAIWQNRDTDT